MERAAVPELIFAIAHDVREPVREIIGFADLMAQRAPDDADDQFWSDLGHIEAGARRTRAMLNALCAYLHQDEPAIADVDLEDLLDDVLTDTIAVRTEHPTRISGSLHGRVRTYPAVLRSVVTELIANAARFGASSDGTAHVSISLTIADGMMTLTVADRGCGLSPGDADLATQLFQRLDRAADPNSLGAGLAIARRKLEHCGGSLTLGGNDIGDGLVAVAALPIPVIDLRASGAPDDVLVAGHANEGTTRP